MAYVTDILRYGDRDVHRKLASSKQKVGEAGEGSKSNSSRLYKEDIFCRFAVPLSRTLRNLDEYNFEQEYFAFGNFRVDLMVLRSVCALSPSPLASVR